MIGAFIKAFAQLSDGPIVRVIGLSIIIALAVYAAVIAGAVWVLARVDIGTLPWMDTAADWGGSLLAIIIATLLFPGLFSAIVGLFLETVVAAVERRHYPDLPPANPVAWHEAALAALRLAALTIGLNLLLLPVYLLVMFIPPLSFALYYAVNGRLLSREYFEVVALRRMDVASATALRQRSSGAIWRTGAATAGLLTVPILNLFAPVIGTAAMVHVIQKLTRVS
tara:strand:- start:2399 stop:3073 length:675 start_codon:yes stop_codon:yes gene_type:complete